MLPGVLALAAIVLVLPFLVIGWVVELVMWISRQIALRRERRRAAIEAELDLAQARMRATILQLATELNADAHEARRALIKASFEASQQDPPGK
ncbi:hypothetical protein [Herbiconiux liangxiaofengii]|uniref:hypothetical protein n=1 Tax=Herbiconiux liangxiaofengii TaxID=3342795 RepID=UPI0035B93E10